MQFLAETHSVYTHKLPPGMCNVNISAGSVQVFVHVQTCCGVAHGVSAHAGGSGTYADMPWGTVPAPKDPAETCSVSVHAPDLKLKNGAAE